MPSHRIVRLQLQHAPVRLCMTKCWDICINFVIPWIFHSTNILHIIRMMIIIIIISLRWHLSSTCRQVTQASRLLCHMCTPHRHAITNAMTTYVYAAQPMECLWGGKVLVWIEPIFFYLLHALSRPLQLGAACVCVNGRAREIEREGERERLRERENRY